MAEQAHGHLACAGLLNGRAGSWGTCVRRGVLPRHAASPLPSDSCHPCSPRVPTFCYRLLTRLYCSKRERVEVALSDVALVAVLYGLRQVGGPGCFVSPLSVGPAVARVTQPRLNCIHDGQ